MEVLNDSWNMREGKMPAQMVSKVPITSHCARQFVESLYHPNQSKFLPDGKNSNFVLKPIHSSNNFTFGAEQTTGEGTLVLYLMNPLGRIAEFYPYNSEDDEYESPTLFNQAQILSQNFDYGRPVSSYCLVKSSVLPAGTYQLAGRGMGVRFPYPAAEKPSSDGTTNPHSKFSYEALVGTQSDPSCLETGLRMDEGLVFLDFNLFGSPLVRLADSCPVGGGGITTGTTTVAQNNDHTQALDVQFMSSIVVPAGTIPPTTPLYLRTQSLLCTAVGGVESTISFDGFLSPTSVTTCDIEITYFMETFDLMGNAIDTIQEAVTIPFDPTTDPGINFSRTVTFNAPEVGSLLQKPVIQSVQFGVHLTPQTGQTLTLPGGTLSAQGNVVNILGQYYGAGSPSYIAAFSGASMQQFNIEMKQWFEVRPNSNLLETTTTNAFPVGDVFQEQTFWDSIRQLVDDGHWRYVCRESWFLDMDHPAQMFNWRPKMEQMFNPDFLGCNVDSPEMAGFSKLFKRLGSVIKKGGRVALKDLKKIAATALSQYGPKVVGEIIDLGVQTLGGGPEAQFIGKELKKLSGVGLGALSKKIGMAGGSLAGGSVSQKQLNFSRRLMCEEEDHDFKDWLLLANGESFEVADSHNPITLSKGHCSGKSKKIQIVLDSDEKESVLPQSLVITVLLNETHGIFVPAIWFAVDRSDSSYMEASGLYYLFQDQKLYEQCQDLKNWSKGTNGIKLVGHADPDDQLKVVVPPNSFLLGVDRIEKGSSGYSVVGNLLNPACGRSVEAALFTSKLLLEKKKIINLPVAISGEMVKPSSGSIWKVAPLPESYAWFKAAAVHHIPGDLKIPFLANTRFADVLITDSTSIKKSLNIPTGKTFTGFHGWQTQDGTKKIVSSGIRRVNSLSLFVLNSDHWDELCEKFELTDGFCMTEPVDRRGRARSLSTRREPTGDRSRSQTRTIPKRIRKEEIQQLNPMRNGKFDKNLSEELISSIVSGLRLELNALANKPDRSNLKKKYPAWLRLSFYFWGLYARDKKQFDKILALGYFQFRPKGSLTKLVADYIVRSADGVFNNSAQTQEVRLLSFDKEVIEKGGIVDTSKPRIDAFFKDYNILNETKDFITRNTQIVNAVFAKVENNPTIMTNIEVAEAGAPTSEV